jgi:signal transduction histidine kinase
MMFKSFTHEIKTPLNWVINFIDLTKSLLNDHRIKARFVGHGTEFKRLEDYV